MFMVRVCFLMSCQILILLGVAAAAGQHPRAKLDGSAVPLSYDLWITPSFEKQETAGHEKILFNLLHANSNLVLNAEHTLISHATIDGQAVTVSKFESLQQVHFNASLPLTAGRHAIAIDFVSKISDGSDPAGLYLSTGTAGSVLTSAFEPSDARRMFPCFDEPAFRSPITLHVTAPRALTVISNMPATSITSEGELSTTHFAATPPMPVYLLAVNAGDFGSITTESDGIPIRLFAFRGSEQRGQFTLDSAKELLHYYNTYFGIKYALPKLDIVVDPGVLNSAMENWGAIAIYADSYGLLDPTHDTSAMRQMIFEVVAHEMAHQWLGDYVDMAWWSDTFVSEGLAEWMGQKAMSDLHPEWNSWKTSDRDIRSVLDRGVHGGIHPVVDRTITSDLSSADWNAFDSATYDKSAAVLRSYEKYIGTARFRDAVRYYLRLHALRSATFDDFWNAFNDPGALDFGRAWLTRPGFPIVRLSSHCEHGTNFLRMSQQPFASDATVKSAYLKQRWPVPIFIRTDSTEIPAMFYTQRTTIAASRCGASFEINADLRPYYRILYTGPDVRTVAAILQRSSERERVNTLEDAVRLFSAGVLPAPAFLDLVQSLRPSDALELWGDVALQLETIEISLPEGRTRTDFASFERRLLEPVRSAISNIAESGFDERGRRNLITALTFAADMPSALLARKRLDALLSGRGKIYDGSQWVLAGLAAQAATRAEVEQWEAVAASPSASRDGTDSLALVYLERVGDKALAAQVLNHFPSAPQKNMLQIYLVEAVGQRHPDIAYRYFQTHFAELKKAFPPTQQAWVLTTAVAWNMPGAATKKEIRAFLRARLPVATYAQIDAALNWRSPSYLAPRFGLVNSVADWLHVQPPR